MSGTIIWQRDGFSVKLKDDYAADGSPIPVAIIEDDNLGEVRIDREYMHEIFKALLDAGALFPPPALAALVPYPGPLTGAHPADCGEEPCGHFNCPNGPPWML